MWNIPIIDWQGGTNPDTSLMAILFNLVSKELNMFLDGAAIHISVDLFFAKA